MEDQIASSSPMSRSPLSTTESSNDARDKHLEQEHDLMAMLTSDGDADANASIVNTAMLEVHKGRPIRVQAKVLVPVHDHPNFNFVGKLLGPKGNSLKWLQEQTQTKMAILGRGSMRDKMKEEELRRIGDVKNSHLSEELHVEITAFAPPPEAYSRIGHALHEVRRFLVPDYYDEIRQQQLRELGILNADGKQSDNDVGIEVSLANGRMNDCARSLPHSHSHISQPAIHHITSFGTCKGPTGPTSHAHHAISATHSKQSLEYSDNHCPNFFCMNRENDSQLSHYWHKKSSLKINSSPALSKGNATCYRGKPYDCERLYNIYH